MTDQKTWTQQEIASLREAFAAGKSRSEIARELNRSPGSIRGKILSLGLRRGVRPWATADKALLQSMYEQDIPIAMIAFSMERTVDSVTKMCTRLALRRVPPAAPWTGEQLATLHRMLAEGHSLGRIAEAVGHPRSSIADKLRKLDLKSGLFRTPWTSEELQMLTTLDAQGASPAEIAGRMPGRTVAAVRIKLRSLAARSARTKAREAAAVAPAAPAMVSAEARPVPAVAALPASPPAPIRPRIAMEAAPQPAVVAATLTEMERWLRSRDYMVLHNGTGWVVDRQVLANEAAFIEFVNVRRQRLHLPLFVKSTTSAPDPAPATPHPGHWARRQTARAAVMAR